MCILKHHRKRRAKVTLANLLYIYSVITDFSLLYLIKAVEQIGYRGFACTRGADKRNFLTRLCIERNVIENRLFAVIAEVHVFKHNVALKLLIGYGVVAAVRMLPSPKTRMLLAFGQISVLVIFCVYELYIAVVLFRLSVDNVKYTLGTG